jgi:hypothetical protein
MKRVGFILIASLLASMSAAYAGPGVSGGGESVDLNGHPVLRDLIDNTVCTWIDGKSFISDLSYYPKEPGALVLRRLHEARR